MFYLAYHMYRDYFPLIALTEYGNVMAEIADEAASRKKIG